MKPRSISVILPSLNPSDTLQRVVSELVEAGFDDIIVVNDGSNAENTAPFEAIEKMPGCTVLTHPQNMGKGAALKTAFAYFLENRPDRAGVVTMDGDGQHLVTDVVKCANVLSEPGDTVIMGVRDFTHPDVPRSNAFGNRLSALAFRLLFGIKLRDTQTGLRGIRSEHIPMMLKIHGNRFEYETNMLLEVEKNGIKFQEVEIETIYEEGSNERSHYRPFADSVAILSRVTKYALSSFISFIVDIGLFWITIRFFGNLLGAWAIPVCTAFARVVSSFVNFNVNRTLVFERNRSFGRQMLYYYILAAIQMAVSASLLWLISQLLSAGYSAGMITLLKATVDTILFFFSYYIQRKWVFRK